MPRRQYDTLALACIDAATSPAEGLVGATAHFHEHHRTRTVAQDKVDLAAATPRRPIIAFYQPPAPCQCMVQRPVFGLLACRACSHLGLRRLFSKETH